MTTESLRPPGTRGEGDGDEQLRRRLDRELGGLALSAVRPHDTSLLLRAVHLQNLLRRLGIALPLWVVHDLGVPAVVDPAVLDIQARDDLGLEGDAAARVEAWAATVREIAATETYAQARRWGLPDELLAVVLLRVLGNATAMARSPLPGQPGDQRTLPLDPEAYRQTGDQLLERFRAHDRRADGEVLGQLVAARVRLLMAVEHVDLDTLRLLGLFGPEAAAVSDATGLVDLLQVFRSTEATDVASFTLDLLPSVLETRRATGEQRFSVDGYAGIERRGSLDSLVLTELAYDEELFDRRFVDREAFYYAREKQHEEERRLHYIVIDATAGMRGLRSTFARGLALALGKKLLLQGEEVWYRFFDSRLYEVHRAGRRGAAGSRGGGGLDVPHLLSFRGERGRNYAKVFGLLASELERTAPAHGGTPILYLLTHGECHIPLPTVDRLRQEARLYGVFLLPSRGELDLDYLSRLHTVQVVGREALGRNQERTRRALSIVEDAAGSEAPGPRDRTGEPRRATR